MGYLALVGHDEPAHQAHWRHCAEDKTDYRLDYRAHWASALSDDGLRLAHENGGVLPFAALDGDQASRGLLARR